MIGLNRVNLIGNLGETPEFLTLNEERVVLKFSLATNRYYKDKAGVRHDATDWHRVLMWGELAKLGRDLLKKGSLVHIGGELRTRDYLDSAGVKHYVTEILVREFLLLDKRV